MSMSRLFAASVCLSLCALVPSTASPSAAAHAQEIFDRFAPPHALPHAPQFALLLSTSTHAPLQYSWPSGQQLPRLHHSDAPHEVVHVPQ